MANTSGLGFAPVLHNITPERVAFVYNTNQSGSLSVAQYYQTQRCLPDENLIGLSLPVPVPGSTGLNCETTVLDETDYLYLIENPLVSALATIGTDFTTDGARSIWVLILGFGIPIAYSDNGELIAIASRLHRLGDSISHKVANHTFDRRTFKFFDDTDAAEVFITAVLDGPSEAAVKKLIDRSIDVDNQTFITGDIFIDPYGKKISVDELAFQQDILDFIVQEVPNVGLDEQLTVDIEDPYLEPTVASFKHDAFYWGWFNPTYSQQLFLNQNERRVFLYNADDRAACNIHFIKNGLVFDENGSDHWCNLAINIEPGYASCAGSVDDPGADTFLRPIPFFRALHQGATLGESYLFASEFVSWKTVLIGDPLMVVNFPVDLPSEQDITFTLIPNDELILREKQTIEDSLGWALRQARLTEEIFGKVISSNDLTEETLMIEAMFNWKEQKNGLSQTDIYVDIVSVWVRYIQSTTNLTLDEWLQENNHKITAGLADVVQQTGAVPVDSTRIFSPGFWAFEFTYIHTIPTLEGIFFRLEVSQKENFLPTLLDFNSSSAITGWKYEGQPFFFVQIPDDGFPSNFSGRRIRFESPTADFLRSTETFYMRWRALDKNGTQLTTPVTTLVVIST